MAPKNKRFLALERKKKKKKANKTKRQTSIAPELKQKPTEKEKPVERVQGRLSPRVTSERTGSGFYHMVACNKWLFRVMGDRDPGVNELFHAYGSVFVLAE